MSNGYSVYVHHFPNGKKYVGITKTNKDKRWRNGHGYKSQQKVYNAILKYGWDNIKHEIVFSGLSKEEACEKEVELIKEYNSIESGYNANIGGGTVNGTYVDAKLLSLVNAAKKLQLNQNKSINIAMGFVEHARTNAGMAEFCNNAFQFASKLVKQDEGKYPSPTDEFLTCAFWWEMAEFFGIAEAILSGKNPPKRIPFYMAACILVFSTV